MKRLQVTNSKEELFKGAHPQKTLNLYGLDANDRIQDKYTDHELLIKTQGLFDGTKTNIPLKGIEIRKKLEQLQEEIQEWSDESEE